MGISCHHQPYHIKYTYYNPCYQAIWLKATFLETGNLIFAIIYFLLKLSTDSVLCANFKIFTHNTNFCCNAVSIKLAIILMRGEFLLATLLICYLCHRQSLYQVSCITYAIGNHCTKFHALIRPVTVISLRDLTICRVAT